MSAATLTSRKSLAGAARQAGTTMLVLAAVFLLWDAIVVGLKLPPYLVPRPHTVLQAMGQNATVHYGHVGLTLASAALGLTVSIVLATSIAVAFSYSRRLEQASLPIVLAFRSAPVVAIAPLVMLFVGRGIGTSIVVVTIVSFFPLLVTLMRGLAAAEPTAIELMHVYGGSRWQQIRHVRMPFALPFLFAGLRIAGASALLGAMLSEWLTGSRGLGYLILESGEMRETELLWAAVLTAVGTALIIFWATSAAERRVLHWRR